MLKLDTIPKEKMITWTTVNQLSISSKRVWHLHHLDQHGVWMSTCTSYEFQLYNEKSINLPMVKKLLIPVNIYLHSTTTPSLTNCRLSLQNQCPAKKNFFFLEYCECVPYGPWGIDSKQIICAENKKIQNRLFVQRTERFKTDYLWTK